MAGAGMPEECVASYFLSTLARSNRQRVLLGPRSCTIFGYGGWHAVLLYQPFCCGRIQQCRIDFGAVLLTELLERPVGDKRVNDP